MRCRCGPLMSEVKVVRGRIVRAPALPLRDAPLRPEEARGDAGVLRPLVGPQAYTQKGAAARRRALLGKKDSVPLERKKKIKARRIHLLS